jgi:hypothetical protein
VDDVEKLHERIQDLEEKRLDRIENTISQIMENQREMEKQLERYSARWGFFLMVGSALLAAVKLFWADIARIFGK